MDDEALENALRAQVAKAGTAETHTALGTFLLQAERFDEALEAFEAALEVDPEHRPALEGGRDAALRLDRGYRAQQFAALLRVVPGGPPAIGETGIPMMAQPPPRDDDG